MPQLPDPQLPDPQLPDLDDREMHCPDCGGALDVDGLCPKCDADIEGSGYVSPT